MILTPPSQQAARAAAGVGIQIPHRFPHKRLQSRHEQFEKWRKQGRIEAAYVVFNNLCSVVIYSIYGLTGGQTHIDEAKKTSDIFKAVHKENQKQGDPPAILCADVNATTAQIPYLQHMINLHG